MVVTQNMPVPGQFVRGSSGLDETVHDSARNGLLTGDSADGAPKIRNRGGDGCLPCGHSAGRRRIVKGHAKAATIAGPVLAAGSRTTGAASRRRSLAACLGLGAVATVLGALSGIASLIGIGLALAFCCAGPVIVTGAAAGSAATGALTSGSALWLAWSIAIVSGLAAFWAYRLAVRRLRRPARGTSTGHAGTGR